MAHPGDMGPPPVPLLNDSGRSKAMTVYSSAMTFPSSCSASHEEDDIIIVDLTSDCDCTAQSPSKTTPRKRSNSTSSITSETSDAPSPAPSKRARSASPAENASSDKSLKNSIRELNDNMSNFSRELNDSLSTFSRSLSYLSTTGKNGLVGPQTRRKRGSGSTAVSRRAKQPQAPQYLRTALVRVSSKMQDIGFADAEADVRASTVPILVSRFYDRAPLEGNLGKLFVPKSGGTWSSQLIAAWEDEIWLEVLRSTMLQALLMPSGAHSLPPRANVPPQANKKPTDALQARLLHSWSSKEFHRQLSGKLSEASPVLAKSTEVIARTRPSKKYPTLAEVVELVLVIQDLQSAVIRAVWP